jgi:hypothetical protein
VHVQPSTSFMHNIHPRTSSSQAAGAKPASSNSTNRAPGPRFVRSVATIQGARQDSGQTNFRAASTIDFSDLGASSVLYAA